MAKIQIMENRPPVLGINSLGRIGKLSLWHHIGRNILKRSLLIWEEKQAQVWMPLPR